MFRMRYPSLKFVLFLHLFNCAIMQDFELSVYSPKESSTSKTVPCNNSLCAQRDQCLEAFGNCPYVVSYVSAETSTTGILIEDVLHLKTEYKHSEPIQAYITFGLVYANAELNLIRLIIWATLFCKLFLFAHVIVLPFSPSVQLWAGTEWLIS